VFLTHAHETPGLQLNNLQEENSMHDGHRLHTYAHVFVRVCVPYVATALCIRICLYDHCVLLS